nr:hypothetical protein BaRGS_024091 [Batillaria attramentaria]
MIVLNFVLFVLIAAGQVLIYWSVQKNSMSTSSTNKSSNDLTIARRLIAIVMSDFLCWFPIGLLGLMSTNDVPVSGEVNVVMAIFVLPCADVMHTWQRLETAAGSEIRRAAS